MKSIFVLILTFFMSISSSFASDSYLQFTGGLNASEINFGFDFEIKKSESHGIGGYFFYSGEEEAALAPEVISFGGMLKLHIFNNEKFDVSFAPGFGISMIELDTVDETIVGPIAKFGVMYKLSDKNSIGVEMLETYNWLSDEYFGGAYRYFNVAFRIKI